MKYLKQIVGMLDFVILDIGFALREKCPHTEFFLVRIQSECGKIQTRKNSVFGHVSRSEFQSICGSQVVATGSHHF